MYACGRAARPGLPGGLSPEPCPGLLKGRTGLRLHMGHGTNWPSRCPLGHGGLHAGALRGLPSCDPFFLKAQVPFGTGTRASQARPAQREEQPEGGQHAWEHRSSAAAPEGGRGGGVERDLQRDFATASAAANLRRLHLVCAAWRSSAARSPGTPSPAARARGRPP